MTKAPPYFAYRCTLWSYETELEPGEGGRGDEVDQLVDLASIGLKSPHDRLLRSRVATRPFQFTGNGGEEYAQI